MRNEFLCGGQKFQRPLARPTYGEVDIEIDFKEIGWGCMN
jgi:hypothetical protein